MTTDKNTDIIFHLNRTARREAEARARRILILEAVTISLLVVGYGFLLMWLTR